MLKVIVDILVNISIAFFDIIVFFIFKSMMEEILNKSLAWIGFLVFWIGLLLFQTGLYTWIPGRFGYELSAFDGVFTFKDKAIIYNLGLQLVLHALAIGAAFARYLWRIITRKTKFQANVFFLELLIGGICAGAGAMLITGEQTAFAYFSNSADATTIAMIVIGAALMILFFLPSGKGKKKKEPSDPEAIRRYDQVMEERKRLSQKGDYASLIPLLIEATSLAVDAGKKAQIWNFLGIAYKELDSDQRAQECYHTALGFDPDNASSYNNLALLCLKNHNYGEAERYMELTLKKAKARQQNPGLYYYNYALIAWNAGSRAKAENYLKLAEKEGYDAAAIQAVRRQMK